MYEFSAEFYVKPDGTEPAKEFMDDLDEKMFAKLNRSIDVLKAGGTMVREPYSKHLEDGIFEVRAEFGTDISRVLYFFFAGRRIILTHGFIKKTQKTPAAEIDRAKRYRAEFLSRKENRE
jgi:phage-related protein